jgi:hypothetical protein
MASASMARRETAFASRKLPVSGFSMLNFLANASGLSRVLEQTATISQVLPRSLLRA